MRADIVALARGWLGTPYHHQASLKGVGCDCLGLIRGVYAEACGQPAETPPPYSRDWAEASARETMIEAAGRHMIAGRSGCGRTGRRAHLSPAPRSDGQALRDYYLCAGHPRGCRPRECPHQ